MQLFGSKLKRTIFSVFVNFQDKNSRGIFCVMNAALQKKKNWKIHFYITEINFKLQSSFFFSLKVELIMLLAIFGNLPILLSAMRRSEPRVSPSNSCLEN